MVGYYKNYLRAQCTLNLIRAVQYHLRSSNTSVSVSQCISQQMWPLSPVDFEIKTTAQTSIPESSLDATLKNQLRLWNLIHRRQHVKIRVDQFTAPAECEIEISPSASQDECSEQRGIDERAGVWGQEASAATSPLRAVVQFVHFKCTQRRGEEVAASFDRINLSVARLQLRLTFIEMDKRNGILDASTIFKSAFGAGYHMHLLYYRS